MYNVWNDGPREPTELMRLQLGRETPLIDHHYVGTMSFTKGAYLQYTNIITYTPSHLPLTAK